MKSEKNIRKQSGKVIIYLLIFAQKAQWSYRIRIDFFLEERDKNTLLENVLYDTRLYCVSRHNNYK